MKTNFTYEDIKNALDEKVEEAKDYLNDNEKIDLLFKEAIDWAKKIPGVGKYAADVIELIELVKCHVSGEYKGLDVTSCILIVGGLLYFVSPVDLIPDVVPFIGVVDDLAVLNFILKMVKPDLTAFREWKESK